MFRSLLIGLCIISLYAAQAQQLFNKDSELELEIDKSNNAYVTVKLASESMLLPLARIMGVTEAEIRNFNKLTTKKFNNKDIKVPVKTETLVRIKTVDLHQKGIYIPVNYAVKKGDTFYKLAKTYGNEEVATFIKRNKLEGKELKTGMKVTLAWLYIPYESEKTGKITKPTTAPLASTEIKKNNPTPSSWVKDKKILTTPPSTKTQAEEMHKSTTIALNKAKVQPVLQKEEKQNKEITKDTVYKDQQPLEEKFAWINAKGIAYWQPSHRKSSGKYILHSTAPINSMVKIYNPMLKRSVDAKVIGRIPKETYRKDVDVVVSPAIAEVLGALDSRFMVEITYKNQ